MDITSKCRDNYIRICEYLLEQGKTIPKSKFIDIKLKSYVGHNASITLTHLNDSKIRLWIYDAGNYNTGIVTNTFHSSDDLHQIKCIALKRRITEDFIRALVVNWRDIKAMVSIAIDNVISEAEKQSIEDNMIVNFEI
jgi:hypothetical protein